MNTLFFYPEEQELVAAKSTFSEDLNKVLDSAFNAAELRNYLGASSLGDVCVRRLQYQRLGIQPDTPLSGKQQRIFELGHILEDVVANWLRQAGFALETLDPSTQKQFEFQQANGQIKGHVDGIIRNGPVTLPYPLLWECKTMKSALWRDFMKNGLEISHQHYFVQVQLYMAYLNLGNCLLTALNKDTAELHHELIPFNAGIASKYSDRAVQILKATEHGEFLPRIAVNSDYFECKMCKFYNTCWAHLIEEG
ncbi:MAG: YqaJ viral recombinase family protein [Prevotellaceae bacterium]|jgi:hypothetical protein|nr:YqaJ viral recombinase family protein [Prevotellaceae bacterium]